MATVNDRNFFSLPITCGKWKFGEILRDSFEGALENIGLCNQFCHICMMQKNLFGIIQVLSAIT